MEHIYRITPPFPIPDGTLVSPFLNPTDSQSGLPADLALGFSLAAGTLLPGVVSKIQVLPFVTQVTFVLTGALTVRLKAPGEAAACTLTLQPREAVLCEPGSFFQLLNEGTEPCEVLYIVSPAYLFVKDGDKIVYDDSAVLEESWEELEAAGWRAAKPRPTAEQRNAAEKRLKRF